LAEIVSELLVMVFLFRVCAEKLCVDDVLSNILFPLVFLILQIFSFSNKLKQWFSRENIFPLCWQFTCGAVDAEVLPRSLINGVKALSTVVMRAVEHKRLP
jgi:hypothetical protein